MAERSKSAGAAPKGKTATAAKRRSSSASGGSAQGSRSRSGASAANSGGGRQLTAESIRQRNQVRAVFLFAFAILFGAICLITGDKLWKWAHNGILGIFGGWALLWPLLMMYIAIVTTLEKRTMGGKIWMSALVIVLFCTAGYLFKGEYITQELSFAETVSHLFRENSGVGGGVFGGLLGELIHSLAGDTGGKILVVLLLFVALMMLTGTTLIGLFRTLKRPVDGVSRGIQTVRERREEEREILAQERARVDIPLEPRYPSHPVSSEPAQVFPKAEPPKKKREKSEKLGKLQEVFGIAPDGEDSPVQETPALPEPAPQPVTEPEKLPGPAPDPAPAEQKAPVAEEDRPIETVFFPKREPAKKEEPKKEEPIKKEEPDEAAALTQKFMEEKAQLDRKEAAPPAVEKAVPTYCFPPVTMLASGSKSDPAAETEELQTNGRLLTETLKSFGVQTKILDICRGPSVTRYEIQPAAGVKISKITSLADDIALNLAATGVRIEAPIPGKAAVGIEIPNKTRESVRMREMIESNTFQNSKSKLSVALGRDIAGQPVVADLSKMPHLLIAGTTGSGKSVCINSIIVSMLYKATPDEVRFLMIDPKAVELTEYNGLPHMLVPVVTDPKKASGALSWAVTEMMNRYRIFADCNVRNLAGYNSYAKAQDYQDENGQPIPPMPQIVIIIDELADLMMAAPKEVEDSICRLAQLARAAGMHLVVATQRPSVDVVTGLIKANIPSRIALTVSNGVDSRTILDTVGAEKLLGRGDMLFAPVGASKPQRVQGCYMDDSEITSVVEFVKSTQSIDYDETVLEEIERNAAADPDKSDSKDAEGSGETDPMMDEAIKVVVEAGQASTSLLQRRLRLGYARAGRLIDEMEQLGIVGPHEGSKPRQVLMSYAQWMEMNMQRSDPAPGVPLPDDEDE